MKQLLVGYTHTLIHTTPKEVAKLTGVYAYVDICYGPGNQDAIANIPWRLVDKQMAFTSPRTAVAVGTAREVRPVFTGQLNQELCAICTAKIVQIKKQFGVVRSGKTYRVDDTGVTEIPTPIPVKEENHADQRTI
jgi:hypothetical protein